MNTEHPNALQPESTTEFVYQMAYCSVLKQPLNVQEMQAIVSQAQRNNAANNITGLLMMDEGLVIQWLEGKKADVRKLWAKLQKDSRHHCIVELLHRNFASERLFPDWSMQQATRRDMLEIVHSARQRAENGQPNPWGGAIATLCILIDPDYVKNYSAALQAHAAPQLQSSGSAE